MRIKENSWIARIAARKLKSDHMAITIGKTIYLFNVKKDEFLSNNRWVRHEMEHIRQFKKYGFIRFLCLYCWESMKHGYENNRFEIEARAKENI